MPMDRSHYPKDWKQQQRTCRDQSEYLCARCGIEHGAWSIGKDGEWQKIWLNTHHLDHDIWNPHPRLIALCPMCHGILEKHEDKIRTGQLELFS